MLEKGQGVSSSANLPSDIQLIDLDRLWSIARRQARVMAICIAIGLVLGILYIVLTPRTYMATSQILIDQRMQSAVSDVAPISRSSELESEILNQTEILRSTRVARVVAQAEGLATDIDFLNPPPSFFSQVTSLITLPISTLFGGPDGSETRVLTEISVDSAATRLSNGIFVSRVGRSSVIRLGYQSHSPDLAYRIVNAYTQAFLQDQLNADLEASRDAADWLQQRLGELGESQREAALAVEQFRLESGLSFSLDEGLANQRLQALTSQLIIAQAETVRIRALSEQITQIIAAGPEMAGANVSLIAGSDADDPEVRELRTRFTSIEQRLGELIAVYGEDHPQVAALQRERVSVSAQLYTLLQRLNERYRGELSIAELRESGLRADIEAEGMTSATANQAQIQLNELQQRAAALGVLYNSYLSRYEETIQRQSFPIPAVRVITEPSRPSNPSGPRLMFSLAAFLVFGGIMGLGFGTLNELRERSFRLGSQLTRETGARFLGYLPKVRAAGGRRNGPNERPDSVHRNVLDQISDRRANAPTTAFVETLKATKITLQTLQHSGKGVAVGIASILPGEGKTTYSIALAEMLAADGANTLLIDADLRKCTATDILVPDADIGLPDVARGRPWRQVMTYLDSGLAVIPASSRESAMRGGDSLTTSSTQVMLEETRQLFDYVIIDLPPLGPVVDALSVLPWTDGFVLVTEWGKTPRRLVRSLFESEERMRDDVLGVVLNKVDFDKLARYSEPESSERYLNAYRSYYRVPE